MSLSLSLLEDLEAMPAAEAPAASDSLDQGIGQIHYQMSAESLPSETPEEEASAPASSTTTPEPTEEAKESPQRRMMPRIGTPSMANGGTETSSG